MKSFSAYFGIKTTSKFVFSIMILIIWTIIMWLILNKFILIIIYFEMLCFFKVVFNLALEKFLINLLYNKQTSLLILFNLFVCLFFRFSYTFKCICFYFPDRKIISFFCYVYVFSAFTSITINVLCIYSF